ncbi:25923_t:CDS:2, partial [Dentiscutata erythropus]
MCRALCTRKSNASCIQVDDTTSVIRHQLGLMKVKYLQCGALHWIEEKAHNEQQYLIPSVLEIAVLMVEDDLDWHSYILTNNMVHRVNNNSNTDDHYVMMIQYYAYRLQ